MWTRRTFNKKEYSNPFERIKVDLKRLKIATTATVATISDEHGLVSWKNYDKSINTDKFMEYLTTLKKRFKNRRIAIFMDNLRVHHTLKVKDYCKRNDIQIIFNLAYYPDGNPIEVIFSKAKRLFKGLKTNEAVNGRSTKTTTLIDCSFAQVTKQDC